MRRSPRSTTARLVAAARRVGVTDDRVLAAVAAVPRERFVRPRDRRRAGDDRPLPTAADQTTSQPSLIAAMLELLQLTGDERVLEIGTGPGYQAALLAHLARHVHSIEVVAELAAGARDDLAALGLDVEVVVGDGRRGLPERAPFDAVIIAAATDQVPASVTAQLVEGGRVVAPIGGPHDQTVLVLERRGDQLEVVHRASSVRFVPLIGTSSTVCPPAPRWRGGS